MTTTGLTEARRRLGDLVRRAQLRGDVTVITANGRQAAAVVPLSDLEALYEIQEREDSAVAEAGLEHYRSGGRIYDLEELG